MSRTKLRFLRGECERILEEAGVETSAFDSSVLIEEILGVSREKAMLMRDDELSEQDAERLLNAAGRRAGGEPLQYIVGKWEFFGLEFAVGPGVLIPRPETELLVEAVLKGLEKVEAPRIAELCSGSGCVAVALAKSLPRAEIFALELSPAAFEYLKRNVEHNAAENVFPILGDALMPTLKERDFDCVVANPPYIPTAELAGLQREVRREPALALDGGGDGLDFYRALAENWRGALAAGAMIAFEIGEDQGETVPRILAENGYSQIVMTRDYAGLPRIVTAQRT